MKKSLFPIVLCAPADVGGLADVQPLATIVGVEGHGDGMVFRQAQTDETVTADIVYRDAVGFMMLGAAATPVYDAVTAFWASRFGATSGPELADMRVGDTNPVAAFAALMVRAQMGLHDRNTRLMREIGVLRGIHDTTQTSFALLETFLRDNNIAKRHRTTQLDVQPNNPALILHPKDTVSQRLPQDSAGLCDIAVMIAKKPRGTTGRLQAVLELVESGARVAAWSVAADAMEADWLRFALDRALPADPQTVMLHLTWEGDAPLHLGSSHFHPDPRFMPRANAPLLALGLWKYVPGSRPALTTDAVLQSAVPPVTNWNVGRGQMQRAVALGADPALVHYSDFYTGLMVRAVGPTPTAARLGKAAKRGVQHLFGGVKNEDKTGPLVDFAYGVAPARPSGTTDHALPDFAPKMMSAWLTLKPGEWSEVHLFLPSPLAEDQDLYLMTRAAKMAKGEVLDAPLQSCFFNIETLPEGGEKSNG